MAKYNFKSFFKNSTPTQGGEDNEYICNNHFVIRKDLLSKKQINYINSIPKDDNNSKFIKPLMDAEKNKEIIAEFIPDSIYIDEFNKLLCNFNEKYYAVSEEYYNFIKDLNCKIMIVGTPLSYMLIYNNNKFVGILCPCIVYDHQIRERKEYKYFE